MMGIDLGDNSYAHVLHHGLAVYDGKYLYKLQKHENSMYNTTKPHISTLVSSWQEAEQLNK